MAFTLDDEAGENKPGDNAQNKSSEPVVPGVEDHAAAIAEQAPAIQQHAIDEAERQRTETDSQIPVDSKGVKFDPKIHTGSKLKSGEWRMRKGASSLGKPSAKKSTEAKTGELILTAEQEGKARMAGAAAASMMFASLTQFFGDEWQPRSEREAGFDERKLMSDAFGDYFVAKNISDFPPGITLAFVTMGYFCARLNMPKTKEKVSRFKTWIALRIAKRKLKKEFAKAGIVARVEIKEGVLMVNGKADWSSPPNTVSEKKK